MGVFAHEFIHGITWALFTKEGFKSISYGILWKICTPYCHCKEPLSKNAYQLGAIMPLLILGCIPLILSVIFGLKILFLFSIIFNSVATFDLLVLSKLIKEDKSSLIMDNPSEISWSIYRKKIK